MKKLFSLFSLLCLISTLDAQQLIEAIDLTDIPAGKRTEYSLHLLDGALGSISVPLIAIKGANDGPVLGVTAAIHGDELNSIGVMHEVIKQLDPSNMNGSILFFPVLNPEGFLLNTRTDRMGNDLNRIFPGNPNGDVGQQHVAAIKEKILPQFDFMVDMHTASFGHLNTFYVRADMADDTLRKMAVLQFPDILLDNAGIPSAGTAASAKTMRAEAILMGVKAITVEYGNPQVIQEEMVARGTVGLLRLIDWLGIQTFSLPQPLLESKICSKSYWIYTEAGGLLEVTVDLGDRVKKGDIIGRLVDVYGNFIKTYTAPEDGIVIGKSANPVVGSGGRIVHLGIEK